MVSDLLDSKKSTIVSMARPASPLMTIDRMVKMTTPTALASRIYLGLT